MAKFILPLYETILAMENNLSNMVYPFSHIFYNREVIVLNFQQNLDLS